jgi:hypothetical protein
MMMRRLAEEYPRYVSSVLFCDNFQRPTETLEGIFLCAQMRVGGLFVFLVGLFNKNFREMNL